MEQVKKDLRQLNFTEDEMKEAQAITDRIADFKKQKDAAGQVGDVTEKIAEAWTQLVHALLLQKLDVKQPSAITFDSAKGMDMEEIGIFGRSESATVNPVRGKSEDVREFGARGVCSMGARTGTAVRDGKGERCEHR